MTDIAESMSDKKPFPNFLGNIERGTIEDFKDIVEVTEKMDGSYFQFGWYNGEFRYRNKNGLDVDGTIDKMFNPVIMDLLKYQDLFSKDVVYCCEYLKSFKHNGIKYDSIKGEGPHLFIIDMFYFGIHYKESVKYPVGSNYGFHLPHQNVCIETIKDSGLCIVFVPEITKSEVKLIVDPFSPGKSAYGDIREGIVIKNSKGQRFKFVSPAFQEVISNNKKAKRRRPPVEVDSIFTPYIDGLPNRVDKAIFRLKEQGIEFTKEQFGRLIGDTVKDLLLEERENIKEEVFKFYELSFKKKVNRAVIDIIFDRHGDASYDRV